VYGRHELRPIVPVVFHQGARGWNHSTEFSDLFPTDSMALLWVPRFTHELIDQTALAPEAIAGDVKERIAQLLMMVAFDCHVDRALQLTAQLLPLLVQTAGGVDEFRQRLEQGDAIMSYAQQLLAEGEAKGRTETQVEVVEGLVCVGVTWDVIEAATGLTEAKFQELKAQLSGADS